MAAGWCLLGVPGSGLVFTGGSWWWAGIYWGFLAVGSYLLGGSSEQVL